MTAQRRVRAQLNLGDGWSGDRDHALVAAIEGTRTRRYPLFWSTFADLGDAAQNLVAQHGAHAVTKASADQFFPNSSTVSTSQPYGNRPSTTSETAATPF